MTEIRLSIIAFCVLTAFAFGEEIAVPGVGTFSNYVVRRVEPDGITIKHSTGITKLYFSELPENIRTRYGADPAIALEYQRTKAAAQAERDLALKLAIKKNQAEWQEHDAHLKAHPQTVITTTYGPRVSLTKDRVVRSGPPLKHQQGMSPEAYSALQVNQQRKAELRNLESQIQQAEQSMHWEVESIKRQHRLDSY